jgi:hypothetical protein
MQGGQLMLDDARKSRKSNAGIDSKKLPSGKELAGDTRSSAGYQARPYISAVDQTIHKAEISMDRLREREATTEIVGCSEIKISSRLGARLAGCIRHGQQLHGQTESGRRLGGCRPHLNEKLRRNQGRKETTNDLDDC